MKKIVALLALVSFACGVSAQVKVEVLLGQNQFLPNESIPVRVRVSNSSGQTIIFGKEDWLAYSVEARDGLIVLKSGEPPEPHDFDVKSGEEATTPRMDLAPYFTIGRSGSYSITATVRIANWDKAIVSTPVPFDVVQGSRLWDQAFGVPMTSTNNSQPEVRKYILQQATTGRRTKLYFRLTDSSESKSFRVFSLGPIISFSNPKMHVDQASDLHLLYQEGSHVYSYVVFNPDGEVTIRQTYVADNNPRLDVDDLGNVKILGGVRRLAENDVPSRKQSSITHDIPPPEPLR